MFAALGPISFAVVASPTKLDIEKKYHYEALTVIGAPQILQWINDDLRHIDLTIGLHQFWCDPQQALDGINAFADSHQPQQFVFGSGQSLGLYVVSNVRIKNKWLADDGNVIYAEVDIDLTEFVNVSLPGGAPVSTSMGNPALAAPANPPGLTTSQSSAPGSTLVVSPATASPSGIPENPDGYQSVPLSTVARWY